MQGQGLKSAMRAAPQSGAKAQTQVRVTAASVWAVLGVILLLGNGLRRVLPIALQPFREGLGTWGWIAYCVSGVFFAYAEGYRGFQRRFSPLVVRRALLLDARQPCHRQVFAPIYAMAFFHSTKRRKVTSYSLIFIMLSLVVAVKRLPYPHRSILDAGVSVGLLWGIGSTLALYFWALLKGCAPNVDPCLPNEP